MGWTATTADELAEKLASSRAVTPGSMRASPCNPRASPPWRHDHHLGLGGQLVLRFVRGGETVRQQLLWLVVAVILVVLVNAPVWFSIPTGGEILLLLSFPLIPAAVTIAVLRHGMYDVRIVLSRLVLYVLLTAGVIAVYIGIVALLDRMLRGSSGPVLAALAIALAFNPARVGLQRLIDRALYGARRDPVAAVSAVGRRLAGDDLTGVVDALRDALRLRYVAVERPDGRVVQSGEQPPTTQTWPLRYDGEPVGALVVGPRRGERRLSRADHAVVDLMAAPLAIVLHSLALTDDLRASRERLIDAAEEERGRLRRELHDSLGPILTGAALKADGIALAAGHRPERAEALALELAHQLRQTIDAVRRIVYGLRPAVLDELGLVAALRHEGGQLGPVTVTVDAPESLPTLPASVEVAAYRIASEALTNVVRHSDARRASVRLTTDAAGLNVTVSDDGRTTAAWSPGVGLASIHTRADRGRWQLRGGSDRPRRSGRRRPPPGSDQMITVVVADDHPVVRDGLRALFAEYPDIELIGEAATGREAVKAALIDRPDVIIMDLAMPDTDGFTATTEISRAAPAVAVLVLTMSDDEKTLTRAMQAGARGYLLKGATKEEILRAVTAVADGEAIFGPAIARRVLARLGATANDRDPFPQLTPREHDVLDARPGSVQLRHRARLGLSLKTVNNNTSTIFAKLNVATRTEAAIRARDHGLGHA